MCIDKFEHINAGDVVSPISPNRGIAIFKTPTGGRFIKVKQENGSWKAITLLDYKGPGLVVFLSNINEASHLRKIGPGEVLKSGLDVKIVSVFEKHAVGEINGDLKKISFEDFFNGLISKIDCADSVDALNLYQVIFEKREYETLIKLQTAFYNSQKKIDSKVEISNENRIDTVVNGNC